MQVIPDYTLRYSKKAKYLQIRLSKNGLEIVVPASKPVPVHVIDEFIQKKKAWIAKHWLNYTENQQLLPDSTLTLPTEIILAAIDQRWTINYIATQDKRLRLVENHIGEITLIGNSSNTTACVRLLKKWLIHKAEDILVKQIHQVSSEIQLPFKQVSIRNNSTRWGSCSSRQHISLCCKLLFMPRQLVWHVLLHELCHTKVMNHGPSFWRLLEGFDPQARYHAKLLKKAARELPGWIKY